MKTKIAAGFGVLLVALGWGCDRKHVEVGPDEETSAGPSSTGEAPTETSSTGEGASTSEASTEATTEVPGTTGEVEAEPCDEQDAQRLCENDEKIQFCDSIDEQQVWGPCMRQIDCWPGDFTNCDALEEGRCVLVDGVPGWEYQDCWTPLVLSFAGPEVALSRWNGAAFDISGTGECVASDWPTAATPWLAIDGDRSGAIEDAGELFGSGYVLRSGQRARHGFAALGEFDSDGDGWISAADRRWSELMLWSDHDGDRRSTPWELEPLASRGVTGIALEFRVDAICDARGNCGVERARFTYDDPRGAGAGEVIDLHLVCQ